MRQKLTQVVKDVLMCKARAWVPGEAAVSTQQMGGGLSLGRAGRVEQGGHCALWGKCPSSLALKPRPGVRSESFWLLLISLVISAQATEDDPKQMVWLLNRRVITTLSRGRCGGQFWSSSGSCSALDP